MADIVTGKVFADGEKGITAAKMNAIIGQSVIQPAFYTSRPSSSTMDPTDIFLLLKSNGSYAQVLASNVSASVSGSLVLADATQNGMLRQVSGLTTDIIDGTNHCVPAASSPGIGLMRLRSFSSIGNPGSEVDQRYAGAGLVVPTGAFTATVVDRWAIGKNTATATFTARQVVPTPTALVAPGTSYQLSSQCFRVLLSAQQPTLAAGEYVQLTQSVEGTLLRELIGDVHSLSLLVQCTSAPFTFSVRLTSPSPYYTLTKLCTISTANQWTLISLPNLPVWTPSATWPLTAGNLGYTLGIGLGAGSTFTSGANDTWQNGNFVCGPGSGNFASFPVNSIFYVGFVQHEPGSVCTQLIDKPFSQSLDECLRYYCKSANYGTLPGAASAVGINCITPASANPNFYVSFSKPMAKTPTVTAYSAGTGAVNNVRDVNAGVDRAVSAITNPTEKGFGGCTLSTLNSSVTQYLYNYQADTGW
jgi:hypothetical protein